MFIRMPQSRSVQRAAFAIGLVSTATVAVQALGFWSVRSDTLSAGSGPTMPVLLALLIAVGLIAGLTTGGYRYFVASWAGALLGWAVAYEVNYTVFPGGPTPDSSLAGSVILAAVFLFPVVGGAHVLGVWVGHHSPRRSSRSTPVARV
jgi:hypothetical protein